MLSGVNLPETGQGAVLFSDISGFTPLTEAVIAKFGPRRGGEEFTDRLNSVYDALITEVDRFGGNIVGFAGDAMMVWYGDDDGTQAVTAALAMQRAMARFARVALPDGEVVSLSMKVAVASGRLRRFPAGDRAIQLFDVLAGEVMERVAACEGVATKGEVVIDSATAASLGDRVAVREWRDFPADVMEGRAAVITELRGEAEPRPVEPVQFPPDAAERLRPWLVPEVARRLVSGSELFLTELRPAAALFTRFTGIDFEADEAAPAKLDAYVRWVQAIVHRLEGVLVQLTIGEKGSYFYAAWGAPIAHDDDPERAVTAALEISYPPSEIASLISVTQVGVSRGTMRTGAYGNALRRTYGVLGDDTNLAARLMAKAGPGEIFVSAAAAERLPPTFELEALAPMKVKGKSQPIQVYRCHGRRQAEGALPQHNESALPPLVGRVRELEMLKARLQLASGRRGQIVALASEAGMGKSRLIAEAARQARGLGFEIFSGECQGLAREASYSVWIPIWRAFFGLSGDGAASAVLPLLERQLAEAGPDLPERAPLLGPLLGQSLPDNDLTRSLDPKTRRSSLDGLIVECMRHRTRSHPVLFVLEDVHWIDEASRHLLTALVQAATRLPLALFVAHRPVPVAEIFGANAVGLDYLTTLALGDLPPAEARQLVVARLVDALTLNPPPTALVDLVSARAGGNPFFIEEVANLLRSRRGSIGADGSVGELELPDSMHSLVLSRIDQMSGEAGTTLKVASVIGRVFPTTALSAVHPVAQARAGIPRHLAEMRERDVALPEPAEGEEAHAFRHVVIQEVAYESLPFAFRSAIHESVGLHLENHSGGGRSLVDLLAFHFDRSNREDKKRQYLLAAGDAARAAYAIGAAISYYERVLPLLQGAERLEVLIRLGEVLEVPGRWGDAFARYREARELAAALGASRQGAAIAGQLGDIHRRRGEFAEARTWLERAAAENASLGNEHGVALMLHLDGTLSAQTGDFPRAAELYTKALEIRERIGDELGAGRSLNNLGIVARSRGDGPTALQYHQRGLAVRRRLNDRREIANSLNNLGFAHLYLKDYERARPLLEESLQLNRAVGDRWSIGNALTSLAELALATGDTELARRCLGESVTINRELGDRRALAYQMEGFGRLGQLRQLPEVGLLSLGVARALRQAIGAPLEPADAQKVATLTEELRGKVTPAVAEQVEHALRAQRLGEVIDRILAELG